MPEEVLILKRNPDATTRRGGMHLQGRFSRAARSPVVWSLEFHEWQGSDGPQYGNAASLEAAKQAFRAAWDRRPKAKG